MLLRPPAAAAAAAPCTLHLPNLTCRTCALPLQQSYFHPCEWDDHNCHRDLSMQRAVGLVNLTRWVACAFARLLPLLLALALALGSWFVAALLALLPLPSTAAAAAAGGGARASRGCRSEDAIRTSLCEQDCRERSALPPPSSRGGVVEQATMCPSPPLLRRLAGYHRFAASWAGGGGAGALTVDKLKQQLCGGG